MACLPGQYGTNKAAIVATNLNRSFLSIRATLIAGIGGGAPSMADLHLGDVVVGTRVMQYDMGKDAGDGRFETTAHPKIPSRRLLSAVTALRAMHNGMPRVPELRPCCEPGFRPTPGRACPIDVFKPLTNTLSMR